MRKELKPEYLIIIVVLTINLILHLIADLNTGYLGDEFLYIESGRHIAAGYMDFSPMIAIVALVQNLFNSPSIFVNHFFLHLATLLILLLSGLITTELGGKWLAVLITLLCITFAPGFAASHSLFLPDVFDQLAWISCLYFILKFCKEYDNKFLFLIGITAALGILTKYTMVFLIGGLFLSLLIFNFGVFRRKTLWKTVLVSFIIISPNILWQITNEFPLLGHFEELYKTQLGKLSLADELKTTILYLNPLTAFFWMTGLLAAPFLNRFRDNRIFTFSLLFAFILLLIARGKSYYYFPVVLGSLPLGAVFLEQILNKRIWFLKTYLAVTVLAGTIILPHGLPILSLEEYIKFYKLDKNKDGRIPLPFENYYSKEIWNKILATVSEQYKSLSPEEQMNCLVWGRHYSQAGGINLLGRKYGLPAAFSFHGSFYNWAPEFSKNVTIIIISDFSWDKEHWQRYFDDVVEVNSIENIYAPAKEWQKQHIFLCRKLKYNSSELKNMFKDEIF